MHLWKWQGPCWTSKSHHTVFGTPIHPGTLPVSEYYRHVHQSLPLDHFKAPRHVRNLIGTPNNIRSPNHITHIIQNRHRNVKRADPMGSRTM